MDTKLAFDSNWSIYSKLLRDVCLYGKQIKYFILHNVSVSFDSKIS